jgi:hypothetical protein
VLRGGSHSLSIDEHQLLVCDARYEFVNKGGGS